MALIMTVLPLAIIAALSIGQRIGQHGWTPERLWGVIAVGVAIAYGAAAWWSLWRGRRDFDDVLRPLQTRLAIGLCGIALLLALPIIDFGAISARSQMARFAGGNIPAAEFDWSAMAFDFGPAGRARLRDIARSGPADQRQLASAALASKNRYAVEDDVGTVESAANLATRLRIVPQGMVIPEKLRTAIASTPFCRVGPCVVTMVDERRAIVAGQHSDDSEVSRVLLHLNKKGLWLTTEDLGPDTDRVPRPNLATAPVEVRKVERQQLFIDGQPVGDEFE